MTQVRTYIELAQANLPEIEYLVEDIIPKAGLVYCYGAPGLFKTNFMLYVSVLGADGQDVLCFEVKKPFKTLWIDEENRDPGMQDKIIKLFNGIQQGINENDGSIGFTNPNSVYSNVITTNMDFRITEPSSMMELKTLIVQHRPDMVVIDSIAKVFPLDERNEQDVKQIYNQLSPLIKKFGVTFVLIHHCRKKVINQGSRDMEDIAGSREFGAMSDSMFLIEEKGSGVYNLKQTKNRYSSKCRTISFEVHGKNDAIFIVYSGRVVDAYEKKAEVITEDIKEWVRETGKTGFGTKEITSAMKNLDHKEGNIKNALKLLLKKQYLKRDVRGHYDVQKNELG